ncbi:VCBS domain-containing protein [Roseobacter sp. N2S]|uniref:VCBS domain-containing protein n=1 Tax=Roseobacter sp. N2S TaxID=2663844 RepID=UPI00285A7ABF|nr:VCBS domain-containing protein [Roseobacter sp. N2S]MDR6266916.1 VCBS repeat-containing protein [Roseobacter sp. N2S]
MYDLADNPSSPTRLEVGNTYTVTSTGADLGGWFSFWADYDSVYTIIVTTTDETLSTAIGSLDIESTSFAPIGVQWPTGADTYAGKDAIQIAAYDSVYADYYTRVTLETAQSDSLLSTIYSPADLSGWYVAPVWAFEPYYGANTIDENKTYTYQVSVVLGDGTDFIVDDWGNDVANGGRFEKELSASLTSPDQVKSGVIEVPDDKDVFNITLRAGFKYDIHVATADGTVLGDPLDYIDVDVNLPSGLWLNSGHFEPLGNSTTGGVATAGVSLEKQGNWTPGQQVEAAITVQGAVNPLTGQRDTGGYTVWVTPADDRGGNTLTPDVIGRPGKETGQIEEPDPDARINQFGEEDWYRIDGGVVEGYTYVITSKSLSDDMTALDLSLYLDTGGLRMTPRRDFLIYKADATEAMFVAVEASVDSEYGAYEIELGQYAGKVKIYDGTDSKVISGSGKADLIQMGKGDDRINGRGGDDTLSGGAGADRLLGKGGSDSIAGEAGSDTIEGGNGRDSLWGDVGSDQVLGQGGSDLLFGGGGNDKMFGGGGQDVVSGGNGSDTLTGGGGADTLNGGGGKDRLVGGAQKDVLTGGNGNDALFGGGGSDMLYGGRGADTLSGGAGADTISGDGGNDSILGGAGADILWGHAGKDRIDGGRGDDQIEGADGNDRLWGGAGNDTLFGGDGNDGLTGGNGLDVVYGGAGDDLLIWSSNATDASGLYNGGDGYDRVRFFVDAELAASTAFQVGFSIYQRQLALGNTETSFTFEAIGLTLVGIEEANMVVGAKGLTAAADVVSINAGNSASGNLLDNDRAEDPFDALKIVAVGSKKAQVGTAIETDYGVFQIEKDGSYTYTGDYTVPALQQLAGGATVLDSLTYTMSSPNGKATTTLTVEITGYNDYPTFENTTFSAVEDGPVVTVDLMGFADDIDDDDDGTTLVYSLSNTPSEGSVSIDGGVLTFDPGTDFQDLGVGETREVSVNIVVTDSHGKTGWGTVTFQVEGNSDVVQPTLYGFRLDSRGVNDGVGTAVSFAGDINGDDIDDILIGARTADPNGENSAGTTYVVFGTRDNRAIPVDLGALDGTDGFAMNGVAEGDYFGASVAAAGDVNGDGFDDLLIGAYGVNVGLQNNAGKTYVVFGTASGFAASLDIETLDGTNGFGVEGEGYQNNAGYSVSTAGDVNGDGISDILIGAPSSGSGKKAFVVYGVDTGFDANLNLGTLDGTNGYALFSADKGDSMGSSVSSAGDVNGDGIDDIIVGAMQSDVDDYSNVGKSYVVFGTKDARTATLDMADLDGTNGFVVTHYGGINSLSGSVVSAAGDVNGDGVDDMLVVDARINSTSQVYVVYGSTDPFEARVNLNQLDATEGLHLHYRGAKQNDRFSAASAGDVNNDGIDDLMISASRSSPDGLIYAGQSFLVFGKAGGFTEIVDVSELDGTNGFVFKGGAEYDLVGSSVSMSGDVNGDGVADILIGAARSSTSNGGSYVIYGGGDSLAEFDAADGMADGQIELSFLGLEPFELYPA